MGSFGLHSKCVHVFTYSCLNKKWASPARNSLRRLTDSARQDLNSVDRVVKPQSINSCRLRGHNKHNGAEFRNHLRPFAPYICVSEVEVLKLVVEVLPWSKLGLFCNQGNITHMAICLGLTQFNADICI